MALAEVLLNDERSVVPQPSDNLHAAIGRRFPIILQCVEVFDHEQRQKPIAAASKNLKQRMLLDFNIRRRFAFAVEKLGRQLQRRGNRPALARNKRSL